MRTEVEMDPIGRSVSWRKGLRMSLCGFDEALAFGGIKASGYGREGGPNALEPFLVEKNISQANHL